MKKSVDKVSKMWYSIKVAADAALQKDNSFGIDSLKFWSLKIEQQREVLVNRELS